MKKKKEIIIVALIILATILIIFISQPSSDSKTNIVEGKYVTVTITGEVKEEKSIKMPKGYPLSFAMVTLEDYLNDYSIKDYDLKQVVNEDLTLKIESKDLNNQYDASVTKININDPNVGVDTLTQIYGIGEARAKRIIENRTIESESELQKILGVSDAVFEKIMAQAVLQ